MTVEVFCQHLSQRGIRLWVEGEILKFAAPRGTITSELKDAITANKAEILALLTASPVGFTDAKPAAIQWPPREIITPWHAIQGEWCPTCGGVLDLQARGREGGPDTWWCPGCRKFA